jgi:hypothetical protein
MAVMIMLIHGMLFTHQNPALYLRNPATLLHVLHTNFRIRSPVPHHFHYPETQTTTTTPPALNRASSAQMDAGWEELERMAMAVSAADAQIADEYPSPDTIEQWKRLFGYSHMEAVRLIGDQRGDGKSLLLEAITD